MSIAAAVPMAIAGVSSLMGASSARRAAKAQQNAAQDAINSTQPYNQFGLDAMKQISTIQSNPGAYIQSNTLYKSMADDAQRRLLANQAAKGKIGSGGTASALQEQLLTIGNNLVNQQIQNLQNQVGTGQNAVNQIGGYQLNKGEAKSAGIIGANNYLQQGIQSIGGSGMQAIGGGGGQFGNIGSQLQTPTNL